MVEHDMCFVLSVCGPIYVLDLGKLLMVNSSAGVRGGEVVRDA